MDGDLFFFRAGQPATRPPGVLWNVVPALDKYEPETPLGALKGALADKVGPVLRTGLVVAALIAFVQVSAILESINSSKHDLFSSRRVR